jgi:hypothetical protein
LLHVGICCKSLASHLIVKGYRALEITGYEIGAVGRVVRNVPTLTKKARLAVLGLRRNDFLLLKSLAITVNRKPVRPFSTVVTVTESHNSFQPV